MGDTKWVIVDTETDGLRGEIHVVEIGAQLMCGWEPCGEPFQVFLNHDVPIPPSAVAVHGYTQEFLKTHGKEPKEAHEAFRLYAKDYPVVAHNLGYDWDRALVPEWNRLGLASIGCRGFCTVLLSRRILPELRRYGLDELRMHLNLGDGESHRALADVAAVVRLFCIHFAPRLRTSGLTSFAAWNEFSRRTPLSDCWSLFDTAFSGKTRREVVAAWKRSGTLWWEINQSGRYWHWWCKRLDVQKLLLAIDKDDWTRELPHLLPILLSKLPRELCEREKAARRETTG